jgi:hypothetical protein
MSSARRLQSCPTRTAGPIVIPKGTNPNDWELPNILINWDTNTAGNGKHVLKIELGTGGVALTPQPQPIRSPSTSTTRAK